MMTWKKTSNERLRRTGGRRFLGSIGGYCHNTDCPTRQFTVQVQGVVGVPPAAIEAIHCPLCRQEAEADWVRTRTEQRLHEEREARICVSQQRRRRDEGHSDSDPLLPVYLDAGAELPA